MTTEGMSNSSGQSGEAPNLLLRLLQLSKLARQSESAQALQFLLVNQTYTLSPYTLGALWISNEGIVAQSGVSSIECNAPFIQWLNSICRQLGQQERINRVTSDVLSPEDVLEWDQYLPASAIWIPIATSEALRNGQSKPLRAGLLLCRQEPWEENELGLLQEWVDIWGHAWSKMHKPSIHGELSTLWGRIEVLVPRSHEIKAEALALKAGGAHVIRNVIKTPSLFPRWVLDSIFSCCKKIRDHIQTLRQDGFSQTITRIKNELGLIWRNPRRRYKWMAIIILLFPMRLTVLAPAELVPANPAIIRAPIEGVVDEFYVTPNQHVTAGQLLFKLDLTTLTSRLNVAEQETQIASSEYRQSTLQSLSDAKSRAQLVPQEGKAAQRKVEADYLKELLAKAQIKAPRAGIALFDDPSEWIGKPVVAGEKVMVVATEGDVEIEAWVPVSDAIVLPKNASVVLYLNATPLSPVDGHMRYIGHEATLRPDGSYAYRLRAKLNLGERGGHVGLKGTSKISGQYVPLVYLIFRKPLGAARQFLGI